MRPASTRAGAWSLWPAVIPTDCGCDWLWYRRLLSGGHVYSGCVGHGSGALWTHKTRLFTVVPDAVCGETWDDGTWCQRGGGVYSKHSCFVYPGDNAAKRCRCACGVTL